MIKALAESRIFASLRDRALHAVFRSSLLNAVVGPLKDLRSTRNKVADPSIFSGAFVHEPIMRSRAEVEFRKAQGVEWYIRQKTRMT